MDIGEAMSERDSLFPPRRELTDRDILLNIHALVSRRAILPYGILPPSHWAWQIPLMSPEYGFVKLDWQPFGPTGHLRIELCAGAGYPVYVHEVSVTTGPKPET